MLNSETVQLIEEHDRTHQALLEGETWPGREMHQAVCPVCQKLAARLARLEEMTPKIPPPRRGLLAELMLVTRGVPRPREGLLEELRRATRGQARDAEVDHDHDRTSDGGIDRGAVLEEAPEPLPASVSAASVAEAKSNLHDRSIPTIAATTDASPAADRGVDLWTPNASEPLRTALRRVFLALGVVDRGPAATGPSPTFPTAAGAPTQGFVVVITYVHGANQQRELKRVLGGIGLSRGGWQLDHHFWVPGATPTAPDDERWVAFVRHVYAYGERRVSGGGALSCLERLRKTAQTCRAVADRLRVTHGSGDGWLGWLSALDQQAPVWSVECPVDLTPAQPSSRTPAGALRD